METLIGRIIEISRQKGDALAVAFKNEKITYNQLIFKVYAVASRLKKKGIEKGDRVAFSSLSKPETVVIYLAVQLAGGVAVFLDKNSTIDNMMAICEACEAKLLITDRPLEKITCMKRSIGVKQICAEMEETSHARGDDGFLEAYDWPDENDVAEIIYTTGTTGTPKGVKLTYKAVNNIWNNTIKGIGIKENEVILIPLPLNHSFALRVLRATLYQGASVVLQNGFTFAKAVEDNIETFKCTALACVPASYEVMKNQMQDAFERVLSKLRYIEFGAGSLSVKQRLEITEKLPNVQIYNTWGSSESGGAIFCDVTLCAGLYREGKNKKIIQSLGKPLEQCISVSVISLDAPLDRIIANGGSLSEYIIESSSNNPGRMILRGEMQMSGYWNDTESTSRTLVDGWLLTGDMVYLDDEGYVYMLGRADDIINVGGEKVSPIEVENIAGQYPYVKECACIGVEDPNGITGQIPVLFVVTNLGYSEDNLIKYISGRAERYKIPQKYIKIEKLPRNRMQKVDKNALRQMWNSATAFNIMNPVVENILSRRSIRKFTNQEIPREILDMVLKCGYFAPSGKNLQTWKFTVLTEKKDIDRLREATMSAADKAHVNVYGWNEPKAIILVSNDIRNEDGCQDASCAAENIMLAAASYGIGTTWLNPLMTLRDTEPVSTLIDSYGIPKTHKVWSCVALGYPAEDGNIKMRKENVVRYI